MKIRTKISLSFLLVSGYIVIIMMVIGFTMKISNDRIINEEIERHLETTVVLKAELISSFFRQSEGLLKVAQQELEYSPQLDAIKKYESDTDASAQYTGARKYLIDYFSHFQSGYPHLVNVLLVDQGGLVVFDLSKKDQYPPDEYLDEKYGLTYSVFTAAKQEIHTTSIFKNIINGENIFLMLAPINLAQQGGGDTGVIVLEIDTQYINEVMGDRSGMWQSGETYAVDKSGYMVTPSIFIPNAVLTQKVDTANTKSCLAKSNLSYDERLALRGEMKIFSNYLGKLVYGVNIYMSNIEWCIITELEESEISASSFNIFTIYGGVVCGFLLLYIFSGWLLSRAITEPIEKLHQGIEIIEKGNLNYKVGVNSRDEIGQVSRSFDEMTAAIKASRADVDRQVHEQTKEIIEQQKAGKKARIQTERMLSAMVGREKRMKELKAELRRIKKKTDEE